MYKLIRNTVVFSLLLITTACVGIYEDGTEIADDYASSVNTISVKNLQDKIEKGGDYLLLDIRQSEDYMTENIPGAVSIPRGILEFKIMDESFWANQYMYPPEKDTEIIIYCKSGKRGTLAAVSLMQLGFKKVVNLEGGFSAFNPNQDPNAKPKPSSGGCGS